MVVERVVRREPKLYDLIINIPPGTTKSTIVTVMLPAWAWAMDPTIRTMSASYTGSLAVDHSTKSRDIVKSDLYRKLFPEVEIRGDVDGKTHYKTSKGGERYATSVGGTVLGFHAHLLLVDDPVTPRGSGSEAERLNANNFMDMTLSTRKVDKEMTPTILVMQRLHKKDPTGNWLEKGKNIKHICLPAEVSKDIKPPELRERYQDGLLDPVRLSREVLDNMKKDLGSYGYAGQMMQNPAPTGGGKWQKWILPIDEEDIPERLMHHGTDWDLAYTAEQKNSASAYVTAGKSGANMYITDLGFEWLEFPALINFMKEKKAPHYIENKASGKSAKQTLNNSGIAAAEVRVAGGDKIARATMATPYAESGLVYCSRRLLDTLYNDSKQGILIFPNGENDDLQDALVQAINRLLGKSKNKIRGSNVY